MLNWGIFGAGLIAEKFATDFSKVEGARIIAAYARKEEKAISFCERHKIERAYSDEDDFWNDEDIDVVYISTPHSMHADGAIKAIRSGKHVLCEKPFTLNAKQAKEVMELAADSQKFLMEAIWSLFLPTVRKVLSWVDSGQIGQIKFIEANLGFVGNQDPEWRLMNPLLGGGALLDVGLYPIMITNLLNKGKPIAIKAIAKKTSTGVDGTTAMVLEYENGVIASLNASFVTQMLNTLNIYGELGRIEVPLFWKSEKAYLIINDDIEIFNAAEDEKKGYHYEAIAVCESIENGKLQHPYVSHDFTLAIMETLDAIREEIDLIYHVD